MFDFTAGIVTGIIVTVITAIILFTAIGFNLKTDSKVIVNDGQYRVVKYSLEGNKITLDVYKLKDYK